MSQNDRKIRRIVIVGGGAAGWMTAAALSKALERDREIVLIESDEIGIIGVGEAAIPPIKLFNQTLGIDENDFLRQTQGAFKLGIQFVDWARKGHRYFHPFGPFGRPFDMVQVHHHWLKARAEGDTAPLDDLSMAWAAASRQRFAPPVGDPRNVLSTYDYSYHFDAALYAKFLRQYAEARGVRRIEGRLVGSDLQADNGYVERVRFEDGRTVDGELFIDCSGFRALLIGEALGVAWQDWRRWLPCDRALAVPCASSPEFTPFTRSTAREAGWQWRIPLQHRTGNGYVYASSLISQDEAAATLMANLDGEPLADPRLIRFGAGRREALWAKNVVAIGLSSGFVEPLESTALHLIQSGIARLLAFFPDLDFDPLVTDEFNRVGVNEIERIRDFLILHYVMTERDDTELWRASAALDIPETLQWRIDHFRRFGRLVTDTSDLFGPASWLAVHIGQLNFPEKIDPLANYSNSNSREWLAKVRGAMAAAAQGLPTHQDYIARHCRAAAV